VPPDVEDKVFIMLEALWAAEAQQMHAPKGEAGEPSRKK